jgi:hypothetical protein
MDMRRSHRSEESITKLNYDEPVAAITGGDHHNQD